MSDQGPCACAPLPRSPFKPVKNRTNIAKASGRVKEIGLKKQYFVAILPALRLRRETRPGAHSHNARRQDLRTPKDKIFWLNAHPYS